MGKSPKLLQSGKHDKEFYRQMWTTISAGKTWHGEMINRRKDGTLYPQEMTITPVVSQTGEITHYIAIKQDISDRKRAEQALTQAEEKYRTIFEDAVIGIFQANAEGRPTSVNRALAHIYGFDSPEEFLEKISNVALQIFVDPARMTELADELEKNDVVHAAELEIYCVDRSKKWVVVNMRAVRDASGKITSFEGTVEDITERRQAEEALLFKTALLEAQSETTIDGILAVDESNRIVLYNRQFALQFGIPDELLSTGDDLPVRQLVIDQVTSPEAFAERIRHLNAHRDEKSRDEFRLKNGKTFDRYSAPYLDSKGNYRGRIWYFRDITDRKVAEERIQFLAYYDALTELPNRILLEDRIAKALAGARRRNEKMAVLFVDLDRFKIINDSLGHSAGDILLQEVATRLKTWARDQDTVARVGGDEFVVVLTGVPQIADVAVAGQRVIEAITSEFFLRGHLLNITCSVGISVFPEHGMDGETLIRNADAAMYCAKQKGPNNVQFFTEDLNIQMVERLKLENGLRLALDRQELFLVYQPQIDLASGRLIGLEALLRWRHPELGLVPPDKFIRIAENSGLIIPLGEWVLRTACSQARRWQDAGIPAMRVAVNVSAVQFRQDGFPDLIRRVLRETGLAAENLELELTESLLLSNADVMFSVLWELNEMGLKLAIDDFGTGYSSLSYLRQFPVSKLKIDRSFIQDVATNPDDAAITNAIIGMAKSLNLKVIAEGVETEAQMSFLSARNCDEIQGYYFSKPLMADEAEEKLRSVSTTLEGSSPAFDPVHTNGQVL